jgi:hypothetical protein
MQSVQAYVNNATFVHVGETREFEKMTFWMDIFFVDQNPSASPGLIALLIEDCSHVYAQTPHHAIFMSETILDRSWCLMEICYRVFAVKSEYTLSVIALTELLSGHVGEYISYSSNVTLKLGQTESFISRNKLPSLHFIKDIRGQINNYTLRGKDIKNDMSAYEIKDLEIIGQIVTILFNDDNTFNRVIRAFAAGAMHQLKKKYGPPNDI